MDDLTKRMIIEILVAERSMLAVLRSVLLFQFMCLPVMENLLAEQVLESDSDEAATPPRRYYPPARTYWHRNEPTFNGVQKWDDTSFRYELHISKAIYDKKVAACAPDLLRIGTKGLRIGEQVYIAFMYLVSGGDSDYNGLARQAQRGKTTVSRCVRDVCESISKRLCVKVPGIQMDPVAAAESVAAFEMMGRSESTPAIPNIIACMDGSHIPIKRFKIQLLQSLA